MLSRDLAWFARTRTRRGCGHRRSACQKCKAAQAGQQIVLATATGDELRHIEQHDGLSRRARIPLDHHAALDASSDDRVSRGGERTHQPVQPNLLDEFELALDARVERDEPQAAVQLVLYAFGQIGAVAHATPNQASDTRESRIGPSNVSAERTVRPAGVLVIAKVRKIPALVRQGLSFEGAPHQARAQLLSAQARPAALLQELAKAHDVLAQMAKYSECAVSKQVRRVAGEL